jgi:hypothetical protein
MQIAREIKVNRLLWAIGLTVLMADTVPHPSLSPGVVESAISRFVHQPAAVVDDYLSAQ